MEDSVPQSDHHHHHPSQCTTSNFINTTTSPSSPSDPSGAAHDHNAKAQHHALTDVEKVLLSSDGVMKGASACESKEFAILSKPPMIVLPAVVHTEIVSAPGLLLQSDSNSLEPELQTSSQNSSGSLSLSSSIKSNPTTTISHRLGLSIHHHTTSIPKQTVQVTSSPSSSTTTSSNSPQTAFESVRSRSSGARSLGFGNFFGTIRSGPPLARLSQTSSDQSLQHSISRESGSSSSAASSPPPPPPPLPLSSASSPSSRLSPPASSSHLSSQPSSASSSQSRSKSKRDFLGLDLHLAPLLPRHSASSSTSVIKPVKSLFPSRSGSHNRHKSTSSASSSRPPSTASSTLSGSQPLRHSHHRLSFQPPPSTRLSIDQPLASIPRPVASPLSSPRLLLNAAKTVTSGRLGETSADPVPVPKPFDHPFTSPTSTASRLPTSFSAPHSLSSSLARPHFVQSHSLHHSTTSTFSSVLATGNTPLTPSQPSASSDDHLWFSYQATERTEPSLNLDKHSPNSVSHTLNSKMRAIFSRKSHHPNNTSNTSISSNQLAMSHPPEHHHKLKGGNANLPPRLIGIDSKHGSSRSTPALVVQDDAQEENCPVCLEDLQMKLAGEKPHVLPSCGHKLHSSCFEAVYGDIGEAKRTGQILGLCGVCRRDMRIGEVMSGGPTSRPHPTSSTILNTRSIHESNLGTESVNGKSTKNKFAAMAGIDSTDHPTSHKANSTRRKGPSTGTDVAAMFASLPSHATGDDQAPNPNEDDTLTLLLEDYQAHGSDPTHQLGGPATIVQPVIYAISETPSLVQHKHTGRSQHVTCMVSIEIPAKNPLPVLPIPASTTFSQASALYNASHPSTVGSPVSDRSQPCLTSVFAPSEFARSPDPVKGFPKVKSLPSLKSTPRFEPSGGTGEDSTLQVATDDLLARIQDWKGHCPADFGLLKLHDRIQVRKDSHSREFLVFVFEEALLCVCEEIQRPSTASASGSRASPRLRLKGRIYIRHMNAVVDSSTPTLLTLTVQMEDDNLDAFVMRFDDQPTLESWKSTLQTLIDKQFPDRARLEGRMPLPPIPTSPEAQGIQETASPRVAPDELHYPTDAHPGTAASSEGGYASSSFTTFTKATNLTSAPTLFSVGEEEDEESEEHTQLRHVSRSLTTTSAFHTSHTSHDHVADSYPARPSLPFGHQQADPMVSNPAINARLNLNELSPIDLMLIISIPSPTPSNLPSSSSLKLRLIKESLDFVIRHLHPRSRVSIIVYSIGTSLVMGNDVAYEPSSAETRSECQLKKTPFLCVGRESGRRRLEFVIEQIARGGDHQSILNPGNERYYSERDAAYQHYARSQKLYNQGGPPRVHYAALEESLRMMDIAEERVSVVTAVNLAYDNILTRKNKNPLTGILLMHDSRDLSTKPQMALVMTRAEAANVPIHTIGWGKGHKPSCLWQLSNHTGGTYSFVRDLYSVKETVAGCIGGMLSVAATNAKMQISVPEHRFFKMKKVAGILSFVLSSDGRHADIELGELRYGERRDILIEMEMTPIGFSANEDELESESKQVFTGTDAFFMRNVEGLKELGLGEDGVVDFYEAEFDQLCDDVPLLEVDASYRDPIAGKTVSRLLRPVLLTVTLTPSRPMAPSHGPNAANTAGIVRRRIELLTSDSLTRALLLVSRRMERQAARLLEETQRVVSTLMGNMASETEQPRRARGQSLGSMRSQARSVRTSQHVLAMDVLAGCFEDIEAMLNAIEEIVRSGGGSTEDESGWDPEVDSDRTYHRQSMAYHQFEVIERNQAAQQAVVLRDQRAWTGRTWTERNFWKADRSMLFYMKSLNFVAP